MYEMEAIGRISKTLCLCGLCTALYRRDQAVASHFLVVGKTPLHLPRCIKAFKVSVIDCCISDSEEIFGCLVDDEHPVMTGHFSAHVFEMQCHQLLLFITMDIWYITPVRLPRCDSEKHTLSSRHSKAFNIRHVRAGHLLLVWVMVNFKNIISRDPILGSDTSLLMNLISFVFYDLQILGHFKTSCSTPFRSVVTLRVWHLFPRSRPTRWLAVTVLIVCTTGTAIAGGFSLDAMRHVMYDLMTAGNLKRTPAYIFTMYLLPLIVHSTMLSLKLYRFHISSRALQGHGIIHRFLKEGMFVYAFAAGTLLYEIVGLSLTKPKDTSIYYSSLGGEMAVAATVVSVCRTMLSIRSLAATHHVDPAWLLNHAELSRVQWRRGANEGEIFVEVNEMDVVLPSQSLTTSAETTGGKGDV
ncbi:hypothetical protein EDB19DRAFT_1827380 [Suillus lakei]|nr:hypothetical protein EDB19DRAFT_1827380 [Suillus lakei]